MSWWNVFYLERLTNADAGLLGLSACVNLLTCIHPHSFMLSVAILTTRHNHSMCRTVHYVICLSSFNTLCSMSSRASSRRGPLLCFSAHTRSSDVCVWVCESYCTVDLLLCCWIHYQSINSCLSVGEIGLHSMADDNAWPAALLSLFFSNFIKYG